MPDKCNEFVVVAQHKKECEKQQHEIDHKAGQAAQHSG